MRIRTKVCAIGIKRKGVKAMNKYNNYDEDWWDKICKAHGEKNYWKKPEKKKPAKKKAAKKKKK